MWLQVALSETTLRVGKPKQAPHALRKIVFLLAFASALTDEHRLLLVDSTRRYGQTFEKANEEALAHAPKCKVLIPEINLRWGKGKRVRSHLFNARHMHTLQENLECV